MDCILRREAPMLQYVFGAHPDFAPSSFIDRITRHFLFLTIEQTLHKQVFTRILMQPLAVGPAQVK